MLPRCILGSPVKGGRANWWKILFLVLSCVCHWKAAEIRALWDEMLMENSMLIQKPESKKTNTESLRKSHILNVKRVIAEGQLGKALKLLLSDRLINPSQEVVEEMLGKHPQNPPPSLPSNPAPPSPEFSEAMFFKAVRSFPTGLAPGPSGLRATNVN